MLAGHEGYAYYAAFSPDSRHVASSALGDERVLIRSTTDGRVVSEFRTPGRGWYIYAVACPQFSEDGSAVVAVQNRRGWRHTLATGVTETLDPDPSWVESFGDLRGTVRSTRLAHGTVWSPDGSRLAMTGATRPVLTVTHAD